MKFKSRILPVLMGSVLLFAGFGSGMANENAPARVVTAKIMDQAVAENASVLGTLFFDRVSNLSTEVGGLVSSVHVKEGDRVAKGAVMFRLNTDFIDNEILSVQASMEQVRVRLAKAKKDLVRYKTLFSQEAVSEREYDDIFFLKDDLVKQILVLDTQLALARLKKQKSSIRAPFDGVVLEKKAETGDWISPGSGLCSLGSTKDLFVKVPVSEKILIFVRRGDSVDVSIDSLGKHYNGIVAGLIPVADPRTKSVFVKVRMPDMDNPVLNMSAMVSMPAGEKKNMLVIPRDALTSVQGRDMVYTIKDGKADLMPITIISYIGENIAIEPRGFEAGMPLVVDGNDRLRPGQAVTIIN